VANQGYFKGSKNALARPRGRNLRHALKHRKSMTRRGDKLFQSTKNPCHGFLGVAFAPQGFQDEMLQVKAKKVGLQKHATRLRQGISWN